jgi:hypothetical protein
MWLGLFSFALVRWATMSLFRRFFPTTQQRCDAEQARQIIACALLKSREPKGCAKSAESGAVIRDRLLTVVEEFERQTGEPAVVFAADGTLTDQRLIEALHQRCDDGELLKLAIPSCFVNPNSTQYVNETWPATVERYYSRPNSPDLIDEKATVLAAFVVHNLDAGTEARRTLIGEVQSELTRDIEVIVKIEEAACWYRIVDEFAYRRIREYRSLFVDLFLDTLVRQLALGGAQPNLICRILAERSEEYIKYRELFLDERFLWNVAKHVAVPVGYERHFLFTKIFGICLIERVERALIFELLTGQHLSNAK